jgi:CDP-glycerol glycerophosphotransferase (TagB/SpsB family)
VQAAVGILRNSKPARQILIKWQHRFTPLLYDDLFNKHKPDLVVASTAGWRLDRYILRAARANGVKTAAIVLGWDNPSSHALPGAIIDNITCWSEVQKKELIQGSDWRPEQINIGGIPSYDGYFRKQWLMQRDIYFRLHKLDPERKLLGYACSFVTYSPNIQNVEAIAQLIARNELVEPCQLLVRLHPNHYTKVKRWAEERDQMQKLIKDYPHIHLVEPVPLGGELGYYSGEDMPEKSSMMAYSDVFLTVYSTMVVEASIHETPIVSVVIDSPTGWPGEYSLPLSKIGGWPTHSRFRQAKAGRVATNEGELRQAINNYLENPGLDRVAQRTFVAQECTYTDGNSGKRTAEYLLSLV